VIDGGEIVERGTHTSLMAQRGRYYELYMSQFRRQEQEEEEEMPVGALERGDGRRPQLASALAD
jgi:ATP-binding cassette subfamily B protein